MYAVAKFQPDMPIALGVMVLQGITIDLYSKHLENKLQVLTKIDVTYERNVTHSCNCTIVFAMDRGIYCKVSFPCITLLHQV